MSDISASSVLGTVFELLAKNPSDDHKRLASKLWPLRLQYDFSTDEMCCDGSLVKLGLAKRVRGKGVVYLGEEDD